MLPLRPAGRHRLHGGHDTLRIDTVMPIEIRDRTGLAEMLDAERTRTVAMDRPQPGERCGMPVQHRHDGA